METSREEQLKDWTEKALKTAVEELLDRGITDTPLVEARPAWVLPFQILIGKIREQGDDAGFWWFISGDLPTDHAESSVAASAREAARYFALRWQIRAANDADAGSQLAQRAEALYQLAEDDRLWS
jgi:hypothetical protein